MKVDIREDIGADFEHFMQEFVWQYGRWARSTFPKADEASIIAHLRSEVNKELTPGCTADELADVFLLLAHLAHLRRYEKKDNTDLGADIINKAMKNMDREWATEPNAEGFFPHTAEAKQ